MFRFTGNEYPARTHLSEITMNVTTADKIQLECDYVDGSIVNGIRESKIFSFIIILGSKPGYRKTAQSYSKESL